MRLLGLSAVGFFASLAALLFVHDDFRVQTAAMGLLVAAVVTVAVRRGWSDLPPFVTLWLDGGVLIVTTLVFAITTGLWSLPYALLVWPQLITLIGLTTLLASGVAALAYSYRRLETEVREATEQLAGARRRALESQLTALSAQINPHFLFNTLNTLAEVVHEDEDQAEDLVSDLASMMRYTLESSSKRVSLEEEFAVLERLLRIESARLGERLEYSLEIDPNARTARVPGLLVQPLVENAVQHGVASRSGRGRVWIRAESTGEHVTVVVEDDGPGLPRTALAALADPLADDHHPGGLRNVVERARLAWPANVAACDVGEREGGGTRILLRFPREVA